MSPCSQIKLFTEVLADVTTRTSHYESFTMSGTGYIRVLNAPGLQYSRHSRPLVWPRGRASRVRVVPRQEGEIRAWEGTPATTTTTSGCDASSAAATRKSQCAGELPPQAEAAVLQGGAPGDTTRVTQRGRCTCMFPNSLRRVRPESTAVSAWRAPQQAPQQASIGPLWTQWSDEWSTAAGILYRTGTPSSHASSTTADEHTH